MEPGGPAAQDLDLRAGRTGDAAAHLREGLGLAARTGIWVELLTGLFRCGDLCAATGRAAEALTLWAACTAAGRQGGLTEPPWFELRWEEQMCQAGRRWDPAGHGRLRTAVRR